MNPPPPALQSAIPNHQSSILLIAHRGASHDAPENTHAAFRLAAQQRADGIECDIHLTRDGEIVCIHDANTKRTTGANRRVDACTWDELRALDAGCWKGSAWSGERIPRLADVLAELPAHMVIQIEIKAGADLVPRLIPLLRAMPGHGHRVTVIAFETAVVRAFKQAAPDIRALWLTGYSRRGLRWIPRPESILETLAATGADGLGSKAHPALNAELAHALHDRHLALCAWTVDTPATARRLHRLSVEAIATNRPAWLRTQLGS